MSFWKEIEVFFLLYVRIFSFFYIEILLTLSTLSFPSKIISSCVSSFKIGDQTVSCFKTGDQDDTQH